MFSLPCHTTFDAQLSFLMMYFLLHNPCILGFDRSCSRYRDGLTFHVRNIQKQNNNSRNNVYTDPLRYLCRESATWIPRHSLL